MSTMKILRKKHKNCHMYRLYHKELFDVGPTSLLMVSPSCLSTAGDDDIFKSLRFLESILYGFQECPKIILEHLQLLENVISFKSNGDNDGWIISSQNVINKQEYKAKIQQIVQHNGLQILFALLLVDDIGKTCKDKRSHICVQLPHKVHIFVLKIYLILAKDSEIGIQLSESPDMLNVLFSLAGREATCPWATELIEHILVHRKTPLRLSSINGLDTMIRECGDWFLGKLCNILSITVSDLDLYENQSLLFEQSKRRQNNRDSAHFRDANQRFVLDIPEFLPKLVRNATKLPYEPRCDLAKNELDHWIANINSSIDQILDVFGEAENVDDDLIEMSVREQVDPMQERVESVYVLGLVLLGRQGKDVQSRLAQLHLIPKLSLLFDNFLWKCDTSDTVAFSGQMYTCECNPEVALKIQFLRLVHSYCDQCDYRYLMLTPEEYGEVKEIGVIVSPFPDTWECSEECKYNKNSKSKKTLYSASTSKITTRSGAQFESLINYDPSSSSQSSSDIEERNSRKRRPTIIIHNQRKKLKLEDSKDFLKFNNSSYVHEYKSSICLRHNDNLSPQYVDFDPKLTCSGSMGLLCKIVDALKKESPTSTFRFWFSRAIESYLRSPNPYADQIFLLRRGLLEYLGHSLLEEDRLVYQKEVLQSTFDLLGELLRFNKEAHIRLDDMMTTLSREQKLFDLMNNNIVDSNMLIRSLILSHDYFTHQLNDKELNLKSIIFKHITTFDERLEILVKLIKIITVDTLTQENVSCLNTSLVILILAYRQNKLPLYLDGLRNYPDNNTPLLSNLRALLKFWLTHYLFLKDKDWYTLQTSSGISFSYWCCTVETMVANNLPSPDCISHYLQSETTSSRTS